jgi:hypothetical protein
MEMPYVKGFLKIATRGHPDQGLPGGEGPVDPDYGIGIEHPDQGLPGPVDPGYGVELPPVIDNELPPAPGVWPPQRPNYPVDPDYGLPVPPNVWPKPPGTVWPPRVPIYPTHPIYPGGRPSHPIAPGGRPPRPDQGLPGEPPAPDQGLPPHVDHELPEVLPPGAVWPPLPPDIQGKILCFVWIVGIGYRWTVIDPSLTPEHPIAPGGTPTHPIAPGGKPPTVDNTLPPTAQPKR